MVATNGTNGNTVRLTSWQWISLLGAVVASVAAFYNSMGTLSNNVDLRMSALDSKWEERTEKFVAELKSDIKDIRDGIPPEWFEKVVNGNTADIRLLRTEVAAMRTKCDEFKRHIIANTPK